MAHVFDQGGFGDLREGIQSRFQEARKDGDMDSQNAAVAQAVEEWEVQEVARELSMSVDDVLLVKEVFDGFDADASGSLDAEEFQQAVSRLLQHRDQTLDAERVKFLCQSYWWEGDASRSNSINFKQFLKWYSSNGFNEELMLTEDERRIRRLAARHNVSKEYVGSIWRLFESYDKDGSGTVDMEEFRDMLHRALKVPAHLDLPASRVRYFWSEIDTDGSGTVVFEEFLAWWVKYFDESSSLSLKHVPFEDFYKQVRRMGRKHLDPPAYAGNGWEALDLDLDDY